MNYFGTDGIRGIPNVDLNFDLVSSLGKALSIFNVKDVYIASDTRESKDFLISCLSSGILSLGMNVHYLGIMSTSGLIYYSYVNKVIGVMITASHNPYYDNGIKIINKGFKLNKDEEEKIESLINNNDYKYLDVGSFYFEENKVNIYLDFLKKHIVKTNLSICLDCANGSTYKIAQEIFKDVSNKIIYIGINPNGKNINLDVGSTHLEKLKETVRKNKCDLGFAFDGDGDRLIAIDKNCQVIDGDLLVYIFATYLLENNLLNKNYVVLSKMANIGVINALKSKGIKVKEVDVGDKYIYQEIKNNDYVLGGEESGHIILNNLFHTGDGILAALYLIKILEEKKQSLLELIKDISIYPSILYNLKVKDKNNILKNKNLDNYLKSLKEKYKDDIKIVIRPSGTEDKLRIFIMSKEKDINQKILDNVLNIINVKE